MQFKIDGEIYICPVSNIKKKVSPVYSGLTCFVKWRGLKYYEAKILKVGGR